MGYKNYISVYCEGKKIVKNYDYTDHPYKNTPYGLHFNDDSFENQTITVKIHSCENRIHYVFIDKTFSDINFQSSYLYRENDDDTYDQLFKFTPKRNLKICFFENCYIKEQELCYIHKSGSLNWEYFPINLSGGKLDENNFKAKKYVCINKKWVYILIPKMN
ncbi:hypothetical protein IIV22_126R [Invertebrate iridescent virus 22]|uniref:Uncharacterized protein n=1 Tax=Invertebrate iridescent virus 22 TaxID=345198 RepID=S6DA86_9VIRU|nr:hypothetical protein IIV22_126R [Invertebrate iridescent virus 22]CCV01803.1 hypothetical protein IIV22_126R [Invertebrate iridescent virus 22]